MLHGVKGKVLSGINLEGLALLIAIQSATAFSYLFRCAKKYNQNNQANASRLPACMRKHRGNGDSEWSSSRKMNSVSSGDINIINGNTASNMPQSENNPSSSRIDIGHFSQTIGDTQA